MRGACRPAVAAEPLTSAPGEIVSASRLAAPNFNPTSCRLSSGPNTTMDSLYHYRCHEQVATSDLMAVCTICLRRVAWRLSPSAPLGAPNFCDPNPINSQLPAQVPPVRSGSSFDGLRDHFSPLLGIDYLASLFRAQDGDHILLQNPTRSRSHLLHIWPGKFWDR